jgi:hypothetical protein
VGAAPKGRLGGRLDEAGRLALAIARELAAEFGWAPSAAATQLEDRQVIRVRPRPHWVVLNPAFRLPPVEGQ